MSEMTRKSRFKGKIFLMLMLWSLLLVLGTVFAMFQDRGTAAFTWYLIVFPIAKVLGQASALLDEFFIGLMVAQMAVYSGIFATMWRRPWLVYSILAVLHVGIACALLWDEWSSPH
ncbi:MAG: hypothetical protein HY735_06125 [Verrucomicrobia bacterium]|nr:hypothetical protein [Verrucomicrobiota bacterium]